MPEYQVRFTTDKQIPFRWESVSKEGGFQSKEEAEVEAFRQVHTGGVQQAQVIEMKPTVITRCRLTERDEIKFDRPMALIDRVLPE